MKYKNVMNRRTFLRGAAGATIALPFLDTMIATSAYSVTPNPPDRLLTLFFGLGIPKEYTTNGFAGSLAPLAPFTDDFAVFRNVHLRSADGGGNNHYDGGGSCFVGLEPQGNVKASGPSVDQVLKKELHPTIAPTSIQTLLAGTFFRRTGDAGATPARYVHSWDETGSAVDQPIENPSELFERVFGENPGGMSGNGKATRYRKSILDSVVKQYQFIQSERSPFGGLAKAKIANHLERVRELETRILNEEMETTAACSPTEMPVDPDLLNGQVKDPGGADGVAISVDNWQRHWRLLVDTYVLALRCDLTRFGNLMYQSAGERVRLRGDYRFGGELIRTFNDSTAAHEYWHGYRPNRNNANDQAQADHIHYMMNEISYYFAELDDNEFLDENGQTILKNATIMMGTELGNGAVHDLDNVFHAVSTSNGRFKAGLYEETDRASNLYSTVLKGMGHTKTMGSFDGYMDSILDNPYKGT